MPPIVARSADGGSSGSTGGALRAPSSRPESRSGLDRRCQVAMAVRDDRVEPAVEIRNITCRGAVPPS
jgi:hypothetical protein